MDFSGKSMPMLFIATLLLELTCIAASGNRSRQHVLYGSEAADLIQLRNSFSPPLILYANWTGSPCSTNGSQWFGITCQNSRVAGVSLPGMRLSGSIPSTVLQNLWYLASLDLSNNALYGTLPTLQGLINLRVVSFASNQFSGTIPLQFVALPNLAQLELQDNNLIGTIPAFNQQALGRFNVSYNHLEGRIPNNPVLQGFPTTSFANNLRLCGKPLSNPCSSPASPAPPSGQTGTRASSLSSGKSLRSWAIVLIVISALAVVCMVTVCFLFCLKRRSKKATQKAFDLASLAKGSGTSETISEANQNKNLMFYDKEKATCDLDDLMKSPAEWLGKGELGNTFRAIPESGPIMVVKRLLGANGVSKEEFVQQMQLLGRLRHENLVEMLSFHCSKQEKLVVFEHVSGGNLFQLLHDNRGEARIVLKWESRLNIVKGIARGLAYLHESTRFHKITHANLKSSNVLIDHNDEGKEYNSRLTDYGFYSILPSTQVHRLAVGKVPEFSQGMKLADKADVYCFGLVLLEVVTGRFPGDEEDLPGWVRSNVTNSRPTDILDMEIASEKERYSDMLKLTQIALDCLELDPERRPVMNDVVKRIEEI
ncbi:leucine-rich repeat receptor-like protein kinase PXC1 isoform X2 [Curcuma longa]|uniref:leucine-rich repeat receptor-like protein kinase PXC1 isoform X2 n=1 Tax=Curcuma longa TaxID=136217 RepID=UPI003D9E38A6